MRISDWSSDVCSSDLPIGPAGAEEYVALRRRLGLDRAVLVQPGAYGFDHACLVDALGQLDAGADGKGGHARGVAAVAPSVRSEEHTSELQSLMRISYAVFCLKKKNKNEQNDRAR